MKSIYKVPPLKSIYAPKLTLDESVRGLVKRFGVAAVKEALDREEHRLFFAKKGK